MKRTSSLKRSPFKRGSKKKRRPKPLIAKADTRSRVSKGPARDEKHLALVRQWGCVICVAHRGSFGATEAHHPRELFSRTGGKRISDYLAVPLCWKHHSDQSPGDSVHKINRAIWWSRMGFNPMEWLKNFLVFVYPEPRPEGVAEALAMIEKQRTMDGRTVPRV